MSVTLRPDSDALPAPPMTVTAVTRRSSLLVSWSTSLSSTSKVNGAPGPVITCCSSTATGDCGSGSTMRTNTRPMLTPPLMSPTWNTIAVGPGAEPAVKVTSRPVAFGDPERRRRRRQNPQVSSRAVGVDGLAQEVDQRHRPDFDDHLLVTDDGGGVGDGRRQDVDHDVGAGPQTLAVGHLVAAVEHSGSARRRRERDAPVAGDVGCTASGTSGRPDDRRTFPGRVAVVAQHVDRHRDVHLGGRRVVAGEWWRVDRFRSTRTVT